MKTIEIFDIYIKIEKPVIIDFTGFSNFKNSFLRKVRDSNSRSSYPLNGFRDRPIRPLWQLSFIERGHKITIFFQKTERFIEFNSKNELLLI